MKAHYFQADGLGLPSLRRWGVGEDTVLQGAGHRFRVELILTCFQAAFNSCSKGTTLQWALGSPLVRQPGDWLTTSATCILLQLVAVLDACLKSTNRTSFVCEFCPSRLFSGFFQLFSG